MRMIKIIHCRKKVINKELKYIVEDERCTFVTSSSMVFFAEKIVNIFFFCGLHIYFLL